ncbi:hypothetical protein IM043_gp237 [Bacillus phage SPG24]|nr:hypothetical protein IM043_gp237 [Bacillus phage SPG24]
MCTTEPTRLLTMRTPVGHYSSLDDV